MSHVNNEQALLDRIGVERFEDLLPSVPKNLLSPTIDIPSGKSELELSEDLEAYAAKDATYASFLGAGAYDHFIPQTVWELVKRGEFLTAYTPYQAEASQGTLTALFEYQTMVCELLSMDVANASMYDGATSLAEAAIMARRHFMEDLGLPAKRLLVPRSLHPHYKSTLAAYLKYLDVTIVEIPYDSKTGKLALKVLENELKDPSAFAFITGQPNFFGIIEDTDAIAEIRRKHRALQIAYVNNPISLGLLCAPGDYAADIAVSDGQALGLPLSYGGPYAGLFACKQEYVRRLPGRICGRTVDKNGKTGYTLTLQSREQHIRREKATSNICT
ncbi:MAG: aminomethyl-transferring glycine dehydrogenase subunit GcvPA, partial [Elusimicrobiota bacterium]